MPRAEEAGQTLTFQHCQTTRTEKTFLGTATVRFQKVSITVSRRELVANIYEFQTRCFQTHVCVISFHYEINSVCF